MDEKNYQQLVERIEKLEVAVAEQAETSIEVLTTLKHMSGTLDQLVNGKGSIRCAEHDAHLTSLKETAERNHTEATGFTRRIAGDLAEHRTYCAEHRGRWEKEYLRPLDVRIDKLENDKAKWLGILIGVQAVLGLGITIALKLF